MNHVNRYGESNPRPAKGPALEILSEDEYGMHRTESVEELDWSHDPRSESAHERHRAEEGHEAGVSDETLEQRLFEALGPCLEAPGPSDVTILVRSGVVTLTGIVRSREQKKQVQELVDAFPEVRDIFNQLRIEA